MGRSTVALLPPALVLAVLIAGGAVPARAQNGPGETGPGLVGATPPPSAGAPRSPGPRERRVEWLALHGWLGGIQGAGDPDNRGVAAGAELVLFTLRWRHVYWEVLRLGGGVPLVAWCGGALGVRLRLDREGRHELRIGVHVTAALFNFYLALGPTESGVQIRYVWHSPEGVALHVGLMQLSYPLAGAVATLGFAL